MIKRISKRYRFMCEHLWTSSHLSSCLDQDIAEAERIRVEEHARACPKCHRMLETLKRTLEGLRSMSGEYRAPSGLADSVIERMHAQR